MEHLNPFIQPLWVRSDQYFPALRFQPDQVGVRKHLHVLTDTLARDTRSRRQLGERPWRVRRQPGKQVQAVDVAKGGKELRVAHFGSTNNLSWAIW